MAKVRPKTPLIIAILVVLLVLAGGVYWALNAYDPVDGLRAAVSHLVTVVRSEETSPAAFIVLMTALPIVGFPISLFLVAAGLKFGLLGGLAVSAAVMPVHLMGAYVLAARLLHGPTRWLAVKIGYEIPRIPDDRAATFTFVFFAIPGIPYALKNLLLPLGGVSFRRYFITGWIVQWVMGIPFMGVGDSMARMNPYVLGAFVGVLIIGYLVIRWFRARYGHIVE
jgi:uncharacterized membrane protein YdjX (TVP38/TMEM64 family)